MDLFSGKSPVPIPSLVVSTTRLEVWKENGYYRSHNFYNRISISSVGDTLFYPLEIYQFLFKVVLGLQCSGIFSYVRI